MWHWLIFISLGIRRGQRRYKLSKSVSRQTDHLISFRRIIRFGPYVRVVPFLCQEMLLVLIWGYYKTLELWKVCTSLVLVDSQYSNQHMSTVYQRLALLPKTQTAGRRKLWWWIHPLDILPDGQLDGLKSPASTNQYCLVRSDFSHAALMTQVDKHYFCSTSPPHPRVTNVFLMDWLLELCSPHSGLPFWPAAPW